MRWRLVAALLALPACTAEPVVPATAAACAGCHAEQAAAFATSAHARSDRSPVLLAMVPHVERAWGPTASARCTTCHAPMHATDEPNVTCVSCHAAVGSHGARDGELVIDLDVPLAGPLGDDESMQAHATRRGDLLAAPQLCGTCHEVTGPALFVEPTLTEHELSPAFADGDTCQDCHLPELPDGPIALGSPRTRARRDHAFVGIDPPWGADADARAAAEIASRELLARALEVDVVIDGDAATVRVTNVARGHSVPTGVAFARDLWVDVEALDASGATLATSARAIEIGDRPMRGDEPVALPTDADRIEHRALAPDEARAITIAIPSGATAVRATLRARAFRADMLDALDLGSLADEVPTLRVTDVEARR